MATIDPATRADGPDRSPALDFAFERLHRALELDSEGGSPYPSGTVFVAADMPGAARVIARHAREGKPISLVFADGEERLLLPGDPAQPARRLRLPRSGFSLLAFLRRRLRSPRARSREISEVLAQLREQTRAFADLAHDIEQQRMTERRLRELERGRESGEPPS